MKRYDYDRFHECIVEYPDGKYVLYSDYLAEINKCPDCGSKERNDYNGRNLDACGDCGQLLDKA
jgi:hypothetical protein